MFAVLWVYRNYLQTQPKPSSQIPVSVVKCPYLVCVYVCFLYISTHIRVWVNTYRYIFSGMNILLPAILGFTRYQGFDPSPSDFPSIFMSSTPQDIPRKLVLAASILRTLWMSGAKAIARSCKKSSPCVSSPEPWDQEIYPLVNIQKTMENHHFSWENPLFLWPFSIAMLNYQRVSWGYTTVGIK